MIYREPITVRCLYHIGEAIASCALQRSGRA